MKRNKIISEIGEFLRDEICTGGQEYLISYTPGYGYNSVVLRATTYWSYGHTTYLFYAIVDIAPAGNLHVTVRITGGKSWRRGEWTRYDSVENAVKRYLEKEISGKYLRNLLCWQMMDYDFFEELMRDNYDINIKS